MSSWELQNFERIKVYGLIRDYWVDDHSIPTIRL